MSPINKYEATGIFISVALMAVALAFLRFQTDGTQVISDAGTDNQGAVVVASSDDGAALADALTNASSDGEFSKLVIDDIRIGGGEREVVEGDTLTVHYIGSTPEGVQFDSSYARGAPFTFTVGEGRVITGWEQGLIGMREGGQRIVVIPADMAYGNRQVGPIAANSPLVFAVELLEIN